MTAQTKDPVKYSAAEWEQLQPALRSLSVSTISTAQQVLVTLKSVEFLALPPLVVSVRKTRWKFVVAKCDNVLFLVNLQVISFKISRANSQ
mgnify:CR=1 FL=1